MILKTIYFSLILVFIFSCGCEQSKGKPNYISFTFSEAFKSEFKSITIHLFKRSRETAIVVKTIPINDDLKWTHLKSDTTYSVKNQIFDELLVDLKKIEALDLNKAACNGRDGNSCSIEFGDIGATKGIKIWSPDFDTDNRGLGNYLQFCIRILELGKVDSKSIFD